MAINADSVLEMQVLEVNEDKRLNSINLKSISSTSASVDCDFLIITHDSFSKYANQLASWRNRLGLRTYSVNTSEISSTYSTDNESTRRIAIKTFINQAYNNWNTVPSYILFIGDDTYIPTWHETNHPSLSTNPDQGFIGTDLYYFDVNSPTDYLPDFAYGRIPVNNIKSAKDFVNKLIQYETNKQSSSFYESAVVAAQFQDNASDYNEDGILDTPPDGYADRRFAKTVEDVRDYLVSESYDVDRIYYYNFYPEYGFGSMPYRWTNYPDFIFENDIAGAYIPTELMSLEWDGDNSQVSAAINGGRFLVVHRDHGEITGWSHPNFNISDVKFLYNGNKLPVVWSMNCMTGWFDTETDDITETSGNCFAEEWIMHDNGGAIGVIASTRISYSGENDRLTWGLMDAIWPEFIEFHNGTYGNSESFFKMGDVINYAKCYYITKSRPDLREITLEIFHYFGDPTMEIFTDYPADFTNVTVNETSSSSLTINTGVPDCRVCVLSVLDNGESYYEVKEGQSVDFYNIVTPYYLTVSKHNYIPYIHCPDIYIQNHTFTEDITITGRNIYVGDNVTTSIPSGTVTIEDGVTVIFMPQEEIEFESGFEVKDGGGFEVEK